MHVCFFDEFGSGLVVENEVRVRGDQQEYEHAEPQTQQRAKAENNEHHIVNGTGTLLLNRVGSDDDPVDAERHSHYQQHQFGDDVEDVVEVVLLANARADPRTVVVELLDAKVANVAM